MKFKLLLIVVIVLLGTNIVSAPGELDYTAGTPTHFDFTLHAIGTDADLNDGDVTSAPDLGSNGLSEGDYFQIAFDTEYTITNITVINVMDWSGILIDSNISVYVGTTKVYEYYFDGDDESPSGAPDFSFLTNTVGDYVRLVSHDLHQTYPRIYYSELMVYGDSIGVEDSCSCPASGNWNISCSDNCSIQSCDMQTNNVLINGTGYVYGLINITNATEVRIQGGCYAHAK